MKQPISIRVTYDEKREMFERKKNRRHGVLLPNTIRSIVCGPSNCGKTNLLVSLIESSNGVRFENVYVYSKSLQQAKYQYLENILKPLSKDIGYYTFSNNSEVIPPDEAMPNSIFIFDDVACDKQNTIREYFAMGRHFDIDSFYLCQTYAKIPKHLIRDNANFIIVFKQDAVNLRHIFDDHVNTDMRYEDFVELCSACWKQPYGFLVIDKDSEICNGRYRRGFNEFALV